MVELLIAIMIVTGTLLCLIAAVGMIRLPDTLIRMHAATKAGTLGAGLILAGLAFYFSQVGPVFRASLTLIFLFLTAPVGAHLIGRAAYRSGIQLFSRTCVNQLGDDMRAKSDAKSNFLGICIPMKKMTIAKIRPAKEKAVHRKSWKLLVILKRLYLRFLKIRGTPQQISQGLALGIFIGMTPFLGFHTAIAVMLASLLKWSKIAAGLGVFVTNPLTAPIIYPLTYQLGAMMTGFSDPIHWQRLFEQGGLVELLKNSPMILVDMLIGGAIIGAPLAIMAYYVALRSVLSARKRMEKRKARRKRKKRNK